MSTFIGQLIGFAVIAFIIWRYVVPPVKTLMQKQQDAVRAALEREAGFVVGIVRPRQADHCA